MNAPAIDDVTAWAVGAVPHADDQSVLTWFEVLRTALETVQGEGDGPNWDRMVLLIRTTAEERAVDASAVEGFLDGLGQTGQGYDLVERLVGLTDQMPDLYWYLTNPSVDETGEAGETGETVHPMAWVLDDQLARTRALFGDSWPEDLAQHLDSRWGAGWEQHPDEHKVAWLADLLTEWEQPPAEEAGAAPAAEIVPVELLEQTLDEEIAAAVAEIEGAEDLTEEELAELRAELLAETLAELNTTTAQ